MCDCETYDLPQHQACDALVFGVKAFRAGGIFNMDGTSVGPTCRTSVRDRSLQPACGGTESLCPRSGVTVLEPAQKRLRRTKEAYCSMGIPPTVPALALADKGRWSQDKVQRFNFLIH